jgi:hypothetical protein
MVAVDKFIFQFGLHLGGHWLQLTGGHCFCTKIALFFLLFFLQALGHRNGRNLRSPIQKLYKNVSVVVAWHLVSVTHSRL